VRRGLGAELRGLELAHARRLLELRALPLFGGDQVPGRELLRALTAAPRLLGRRLSLFHAGIGGPLRVLGFGDPRRGLLPRPGIERRRE
jgi:hypothetical protein